MPLNFASVEKNASQYIEQAKKWQLESAEKTRQLNDLYQQACQDPERLKQIIELAEESLSSLYTAKPLHESPDSTYPLPAKPTRFTLLAADGSQIVPSRHRALQFGLINVGLFKAQFGSGKTPVIDLVSELIDFTTIFTDDGALISEDDVGLIRDLRERVLIREMITSEDIQPVLTVTDGPLDIFYRSDIQGGKGSQAQKMVFELDQHMQRDQIVTAGFIDKPGSAMLHKMLDLFRKAQPAAPEAGNNNRIRISDRLLLQNKIPASHRSALFEIVSKRKPASADRLRVAFFYLNVSAQAEQPWLARVEIPYWVAQSPELVNFVHAVLYNDAQVLDSHPYPYALHRAHELAVVRQAEYEEVENLLLSKFEGQIKSFSPRSNKDYWKGQR